MSTVSQAAVAAAEALARQFEGCERAAYINKHDIPTIGYGHTAGVRMGDVCTQEQAEQWLTEDLAAAANAVGEAVTVTLGDNQAGALVDFTYNLGQTSFDSSTLLRDIDRMDFADVPRQLARWVHDSSGAVLDGLVNRRAAETALWSTPNA